MAQSVKVDVRGLEAQEAQPKLLETWRELEVGDTLELLDDEDPDTIKEEFIAQHKGEFEWKIEERGPSEWIAYMRKIGPPPDSE